MSRVLVTLGLIAAWIIWRSDLYRFLTTGSREDMAGVVLIAVLLLLVALFADACFRMSLRSSPRSQPLSAMKALAVAAPTLPAGVKAVEERYGRTYTEWVATRLGWSQLGDAARVDAFAAEHHDEWTKTAPTALSREQRAYHEAAHAVVAHSLGSAVTQVSIRAIGDSGGRTIVTYPVLTPVDTQFLQLQVLLAGQVMDLRRGLHNAGSADDMARMLITVAAVISAGVKPTGYSGPLTSDALLVEATQRVETMLSEHEHLVDTVAAKLLEHTILLGWELTDLLLLGVGVGRVCEPGGGAVACSAF